MQGKALHLIHTCTPVNLSHKALPEARDKFGLREGTLLNNSTHSSNDLLVLLFSDPKKEGK